MSGFAAGYAVSFHQEQVKVLDAGEPRFTIPDDGVNLFGVEYKDGKYFRFSGTRNQYNEPNTITSYSYSSTLGSTSMQFDSGSRPSQITFSSDPAASNGRSRKLGIVGATIAYSYGANFIRVFIKDFSDLVTEFNELLNMPEKQPEAIVVPDIPVRGLVSCPNGVDPYVTAEMAIQPQSMLGRPWDFSGGWVDLPTNPDFPSLSTYLANLRDYHLQRRVSGPTEYFCKAAQTAMSAICFVKDMKERIFEDSKSALEQMQSLSSDAFDAAFPEAIRDWCDLLGDGRTEMMCNTAGQIMRSPPGMYNLRFTIKKDGEEASVKLMDQIQGSTSHELSLQLDQAQQEIFCHSVPPTATPTATPTPTPTHTPTATPTPTPTPNLTQGFTAQLTFEPYVGNKHLELYVLNSSGQYFEPGGTGNMPGASFSQAGNPVPSSSTQVFNLTNRVQGTTYYIRLFQTNAAYGSLITGELTISVNGVAKSVTQHTVEFCNTAQCANLNDPNSGPGVVIELPPYY